jgi:L-phenylalanine/L-methionine N-acetyltransferase
MTIPGLIIRRSEPRDYEDLYTLYSTPGAFGGTLQLPYASLEEWRTRLASVPEGRYNLVAVIDDHVIGLVSIGLSNRPRRRHAGNLSIGIRDDWQGKGVGTALMQAAIDLADNWFDIMRLELEVHADNEAGIKLYTRFGFEVEGRLRKFAFRDGEYIDCLAMGRLRG